LNLSYRAVTHDSSDEQRIGIGKRVIESNVCSVTFMPDDKTIHFSAASQFDGDGFLHPKVGFATETQVNHRDILSERD
jgi:hypothetical protein